MATIYRKTDKAQTEIETRLYRLAPRLRTTLILVDGRRTESELAKLIPADPETSLGLLLSEGFIEDQAIPESRPAPRPHAPAEQRNTGAAAASPQPAQAFDQHRREAIKSLTDQIGPVAEPFAMRMERCTNWTQLLPVLRLAQQVLKSSRGAAAAEVYGIRFVDTPPG